MQLQKLIKTFNTDHGVSLLVSSHDLLHVSEVSQRILILNKGELIKDVRTSEITLEALRAFFSEEVKEELPSSES
jgi:ABC-2 type transport system ATP-binding protein